MRVVVAGAGVFGSCIAVALARAGVEVTVADPAPRGDNASGVAAGMLAPAFESLFDSQPAAFERLSRARDLWPEFAADVGIEIERHGAIAVSPDEETIEGWSRRLRDLGVAVERLSRAQVARSQPGLAEGLTGVAVDADWRLDARRSLATLRAAGDRLGVAYRPTAVADFTPGCVTLGDGDRVEAQALVIATGASPSLTRLAPEIAALTPIKGHILDIAGARIGARVARFEGGYLCPTPRGVLLGATMEVGRDDTAIEAARVQNLIALAKPILPSFDRASVVARAGVRASTAEGWPLVGRSAADGVWLAVGARRNGWLLAPLVAKTIAAEMGGG